MTTRTGGRLRFLGGGLLIAWLMVAPAVVCAQDTTRVQVDTTQADTITRGPSPRTAFLRSLIVPGWGQAMVGAPTRGGFFFFMQGGSWYMLLKTMGKIAEARSMVANHVRFATDSLNELITMDTVAAKRLAFPDSFQLAIDENDGVVAARALVNSRTQQRQDWIVYTLFFTMASAVDAYVAAHLSTFPTSITAQPAPSGGLNLRLTVRVPVGRRRR